MLLEGQKLAHMKTEFLLGSKLIGDDQKPYFIADIAANHDGELDRAKLLIELAAKSGAHAAKFQHFRASKIVSRKGFFELGRKFSHQETWDKEVYDVYRDAELPWEWTEKLATHAKDFGIDFFTAPYDLEAIDHVEPFICAFKVGSGDIDWLEEIEYMALRKKPIIIATGASTLEEVDNAVAVVNKQSIPLILMQCNTNYTGKIDNLNHINLKVLKQYEERYNNIVLGLSDHTPGHISVLGAIALGARVIEKHFTDDDTRVGPDHGFSLNPTLWKEMVRNSNLLFESLGDGLKKVESNETESVIIQRRAVRFARNLAAGSTISREDLIPLRPAPKGSFKPNEMKIIIGKKLKTDVRADELVLRTQIE
jgi:N-acetylneuraminate synthase